MKTERDIIYAIWSNVRAGQINQDDPINERLLRGYLSSHRGKHLFRAYEQGMQIPDEAFQNLGTIIFTSKNGELISPVLPKIIRFPGNFGIMANIDDYTVSLVNSEEYENSKKDKFNKFHPKLKFIDNKLYLYPGQEQLCNADNVDSAMNRAVRKLQAGTNSKTNRINLRAVLVNPDDELNYDFTTSPYPFPDELVEDIINSVNARDFNFFLQTKADQVGDNRYNDAGYNTREEV